MPHRIEVYAVKNKLQLFSAKSDVFCSVGYYRHLECSRFQAFVEYPIAVTIPEQKFKLVATTVVETNKLPSIGSKPR